MGQVLKCDGCGKLSPNEQQVHIANSWYKVTVDHRSRRRFEPEEFLLCEQCMGIEEPKIPYRPWVLRLTDAIKRAFC